jgi:hypothetical protein
MNFTQKELEAIGAAFVEAFEAAQNLQAYGRTTQINGIILQGMNMETALKGVAYGASRRLENLPLIEQNQFKDKIFTLWQK